MPEFGFTVEEARWVRDRIDELGESGARNSERMSAHEATCAERYASIVQGQERIHTLMRWVVGVVIGMGLIDLGRANLPDLVKAIIVTMH